jgi:ATP-dependent Lhr-like helicase
VTLDAEPVLYVERGGKGLVALREPVEANGEPAAWLADALGALADEVHRGRIGRIGVERFDGEPVVGSRVGAMLIEAGFRQGPRKLTLSA